METISPFTNGSFGDPSMMGKYVVGSRVIGKGSSSDVRPGYDENTGSWVAVKFIKKQRLVNGDMTDIKREEEILNSISHPNIIKLHEVMDTEQAYVEVMEYAPRGNLLQYVASKRRLSEQQAKHIFQQLTGAVAYLHSQNIVHRDIKMDNIILMDNSNTIKLIDFAFADYLNDKLSRWCGTPFYLAPEMVSQTPYTAQVDIWAMGVVLYCMLFGQFPFYAGTNTELFSRIKEGHFDFHEGVPVSSTAKDLIEGMLTVNPEERLDIEQVLRHPWFTNEDLQVVPDLEFFREG